MSITAALTSQLKALKLGRMLDTIDVRLAQARDDQLGYLEFLQLLLQDEIERRKTQSLRLRLRFIAAHGFQFAGKDNGLPRHRAVAGFDDIGWRGDFAQQVIPYRAVVLFMEKCTQSLDHGGADAVDVG